MPAPSGSSPIVERPQVWSLPEQISGQLPVSESLPVSEPLPVLELWSVFEPLPVFELWQASGQSGALWWSACLQLMRCSSGLKPVLKKAVFS